MPLKSLLYIGNKLSAHGYSVTTIETLGPLLESEGFKLTYSSGRKNKLFRLFEMFWVTFKLRNSTDYILIDTYSTSNFWYAFFVSQLARIFAVKYIPIVHGGNLPHRINSSKWACNLIFKNAYINVSPSKYLLQEFISNGFSNIIYIPNTIELENYDYQLHNLETPKLLWVRSFATIYNPKMAVEVFKIVKEKFPEATLCMVGPDKDGSLKVTQDLAAHYNLSVEFTGKLSKKEWISLSKNYNLFLNTTHFDNMPVSVIEAMALGLPVVSTNVGGLPFLIKNEENGLLVEDGNIKSMAEAIFLLTNSSQLYNDLSANARETATSFDWNLLKNDWKEILI